MTLSTIQIPLVYYKVVFHHAIVDPDRTDLENLGTFSVSFPHALRCLAPKRPDILLAMLREDPQWKPRCVPFLSIAGTQVQLAHMVVEPKIVQLIREYKKIPDIPNATQDLDLLTAINKLRPGKVIHVNGDRTDCRVENLRELEGV